MPVETVGMGFWAPLLVSAVIALTMPRAGRRLPPRTAAWVLVPAAVVAAGAWATVLAMIGSTLVAQIPAVAAEGHWSARMLAAYTPFEWPVAASCALAVTGCAVSLGVAAWRRVKVMVDAWRECRDLPTAGDLTVLDDPVPAAFALPGPPGRVVISAGTLRAVPGAPGRVVVSSGMLRALAADERHALLAHERAHLRHRHHFFLLLLQLSAAVNPLLRPLSRAGSFALERWADEEAVTTVGDRPLVARAIARAALATGRAPERALAATGGPVPQRVRALLAPPARARHGLVLTFTALIAVCCASLAVAANDLDGLFDAATPAQTVSQHHPEHGSRDPLEQLESVLSR